MARDYLKDLIKASPVEVGEGYMDYMLSNIVESQGLFLVSCRFIEENTLQAFIGFGGGLELLPEEPCGKVIGVYTDARVRVREGIKPTWVSVFSNGSEYFPKDL